MNDALIDSLFSSLVFCPCCGKELEVNPLSGLKSCFLHGDFRIKETDDGVKIEFIPFKPHISA